MANNKKLETLFEIKISEQTVITVKRTEDGDIIIGGFGWTDTYDYFPEVI